MIFPQDWQSIPLSISQGLSYKEAALAAMRILIQNKATALYCAGPSAWVKEDDTALTFQNTAAAIRFCQDARLSGVQVVLKFKDSSMDVKLDVLTPEQLKISDTTKFGAKAAAGKAGPGGPAKT